MTRMHLCGNVGPFPSVFHFYNYITRVWKQATAVLEGPSISPGMRIILVRNVLPGAGVIKVKEIDNQSEIV